MRTLIAILALASPALAQLGSLTPPPGAVTETMKPLDVVEARTPVGPDTTPGDAQNLYVIDEPGSYYLTEDLVVTTPGQDGIRIEADSVTLDLNGFTVNGSSAGDKGVFAFNFPRGLVVKNGTVRGWQGAGLDFNADGAVARDLILIDNNAWGVRANNAFGTTILNCQSRNNGSDDAPENTGGFIVLRGAILRDCVSYNDTVGFSFAGDGVLFERCVASASQTSGFRSTSSSAGATFSMCVAEGSDGDGFFFDNPSTGDIPALTFDRCTARECADDGFDLEGIDATFVHCTAQECGNVGFEISGIAPTSSTSLTDCTGMRCGDSGFVTSSNAQLTRCNASDNGNFGFALFGSGSRLIDSTAVRNVGVGASLGEDGFVRGCTIVDNPSNGLALDGRCTVIDCQISDNGNVGVILDNRCTVRDCTVRGNGSIGIRGTGGPVGISKISVLNNEISDNAGAGVSLNDVTDSVVEGNTFTGHPTALFIDTDTLVVRNRFRDNTTAISTVFGGGSNTIAPIITTLGSANNPFANIEW